MYNFPRTLLRLPDGRTLEVFVSGPAQGSVLLYHQGTPGNPLRSLVDTAQTPGLRFVTTWRPGYGESTRQPGRTMADVAADTEAVINFLGVDRCLIAGASGGGPAAIHGHWLVGRDSRIASPRSWSSRVQLPTERRPSTLLRG